MDGNLMGNHGAVRVLGVAKKRIIEWVKAEAKLKGLVGTTPKVSRAKSLNAGKEASTYLGRPQSQKVTFSNSC